MPLFYSTRSFFKLLLPLARVTRDPEVRVLPTFFELSMAHCMHIKNLN